MNATAFQIEVLYLHYMGRELPSHFPYTTGLKALWDKLGDRQLTLVIALVPNTPTLSYQQAGKDLPVFDRWWEHPEQFEAMTAAEVDRLQDSPELLFADGEKALITIGGNTYRYWRDSIPD